MPKSRQANLIKNWWADTLDKIYPPVPLHEWNHLKNISMGTIRVAGIKPRRALQKRRDDIEQSHEAVLRELKDSRSSGNIVFDPDRGLVVKEEKAKDEDITSSNYQRTMRRLYTVIWNVTPTMLEDEATGEWQTSWGGTRSAFHRGILPQASGKAKELFQGLELLDGQETAGSGRKMSRVKKRVARRLQRDQIALNALGASEESQEQEQLPKTELHPFDRNDKNLDDIKKEREDRKILKAEKKLIGKLKDEKKQKDENILEGVENPEKAMIAAKRHKGRRVTESRAGDLDGSQ